MWVLLNQLPGAPANPWTWNDTLRARVPAGCSLTL